MSSRRTELEDWLGFLRAESHLLRRTPAALFQLAANRPDGSGPERAARRRITAGRESRCWIRHLNKSGAGSAALTLAGHTAAVTACEWSRDGRRIATVSRDGTLRLWNAENGAEILALTGHPRGATACGISPDGARLVSGDQEGGVALWRSADGAALARTRPSNLEITACRWSPDGAFILAASRDGRLAVLDPGTLRTMQWLDGHNGPVRCCAISPDASRAVSGAEVGGRNGEVLLWDLESREGVPLTFRHWIGSVHSCGFGPGQVWAAARVETVIVWDLASRQLLADFYTTEGGGESRTAALSPDGARAVTAGFRIGAGGEVVLWAVADGRRLGTVGVHPGPVTVCAYSPDGRRISSVSEDGLVRVWAAEPQGPPAEAPGHGSAVRGCERAGPTLMSVSDMGGTKLWTPDGARAIATIEGNAPAALSPDGEHVVAYAARGTTMLTVIQADGLEAGTLAYTRQGHGGMLQDLRFSPDGRRVASASWDETLRIWDVETRQELAVLKGHARRLRACRFSPDGSRILSSAGWHDQENHLMLWDLRAGSPLATLPVTGNTIAAIGFSPDGEQFHAAGGQLGAAGAELRLWAVEGAVSAGRYVQKAEPSFTGCDLSPDGRRMITVSRDATLTLWNAQLLEPLVRAPGGGTPVVFSRDGHLIVHGGPDAFRIRDAATLEVLAEFWTGAAATAVSQPAERILAGDYTGRVYLLGAENVPAGPAIVTAVHLYDHEPRQWAAEPTARCPSCVRRFVPAPRLLDLIRSLSGVLPRGMAPCQWLPPETWDEPRLVSACPHCGVALRFNPFIADARPVR